VIPSFHSPTQLLRMAKWTCMVTHKLWYILTTIQIQILVKEIAVIVKEQQLVYSQLVKEVGSEKKVIGKCGQCWKLAVKKDAEHHVVMAEMAGQEDTLDDTVLEDASEVLDEPENKWCCLYQVLSLQEDFANEKPEIQHYLEGRGHICMFYPKFHCEINPIKMVWG
jgi:hypothetical protein